VPLVRKNHLGKSWLLAMWPLGRWPTRLRPNSGQPAAMAGRARAGGGREVPWARFLELVESGRWPVRGRTGGRRWWPPRVVPGCDRGSTGLARGRGSGLRESGRGSSAAWSRSAWREELAGRCPGRMPVRGEVRSSSVEHRPF
jgi:hypothetical protein